MIMVPSLMCTFMDGSNYVSMVILNLDATVAKDSMFARYFSLKKTLKGRIFKVAVWSQYWCHPSVRVRLECSRYCQSGNHIV